MTDYQFFILESIICVIEMQFVLRYYNGVYGVSKNTRKIMLLSIPYILAVTTIIKLYFLQPHNSASLPIITIFASFIFLPFLPSRWEKKVLFSVVLLGISLAWTHFSELITSLNRNWNIWARYIGFHAGFWIILELIKRVGKKEYQHITRSMWLLLISIASMSTIVCYMIAIDWNNSDSVMLQTSDFLVLIAFVLINVSLFLFYERFSDLLQRVKEQSLLEQQLSLQNEHYKELESYQQQISSLHHDMRNTIGAAVSLARSGDTNAELADYLETVSGKLEHIEQTVTTGNPNIDSVLNLKLSQLRYADIRYETDIHVPVGLPVSFEDSIVIFGNLLDNAREACEKLPVTSRWVHITITYSSGSLYIKIDNSALDQGEALADDSLPQTSKANQQIHGFGLKNIARAIEQCGTMKIDRSRPGVFSVRVMRYNL